MTTVEDKDKCMADYLAYLCYGLQKGLNEGRFCFSGSQVVYPELFGKLNLAHRAIKSWTRLHVSGEGAPVPWEAVACIAELLRDGSDKGSEAAELVLISADCYLRESDWQTLRREDIVESLDHGIGLLLGVAERGEATKTGTRQGVRPDRFMIADIIRQCRNRTRPGTKVFTISPSEYRQRWHSATKKLGFFPGPPHCLRHTGPSFDFLTGYRSLDHIRTRGRWSGVSSTVLRYAKTHSYIAADAAQPTNVKEHGQVLLESLAARPTVAAG